MAIPYHKHDAWEPQLARVCHIGVLWRTVVMCVCAVLVKTLCWKYQAQMAKWIRWSPLSSAGPCSRTPWCWPRLSDSPGGRNMQKITIIVLSDVYYALNVSLATNIVLRSVFLFSILFFTAGLRFQEKKAEVAKKAEVVSMRRNLASTWAPSHNQWKIKCFALCKLSGCVQFQLALWIIHSKTLKLKTLLRKNNLTFKNNTFLKNR